MLPEIVSIDRPSGRATIRIEEFLLGFTLIGEKLALTLKANESASRMGPEGTWVPEHILASARRTAYAVLTGSPKKGKSGATLVTQLVLL